jgi:hypothetical protein
MRTDMRFPVTAIPSRKCAHWALILARGVPNLRYRRPHPCGAAWNGTRHRE